MKIGALLCRILGHDVVYTRPNVGEAPHRVCRRCRANCADYWP